MRKPSEYLPAALAGLRGRLMPDCSEVLVYCGRAANVTRVGTPKRGENTASDFEPIEAVRVLASFSDFPGMAKWATVTYRDAPRIVTSAKVDPSRSVLTIGMTEPLEPVVWTRDAAPHNTATFNAAIDDRGPSQNAGPTYGPVVADAVKAFVCGGDAMAAKIAIGDTLRRMNGETLTIQQIKVERPFALILTCTRDMKPPLL